MRSLRFVCLSLILCQAILSNEAARKVDRCGVLGRREWSAVPPVKVEYQKKPVEYVIIHHTGGLTCDKKRTCAEVIENIQGYHMRTLDYYDIGYNFMIGNDGNIYEGVGWHQIGAHTYGYNSRSIGIAFLGDFQDDLPSNLALVKAQRFLECGKRIGELAGNYSLLGGKQVISSLSPGYELFKEIQDWDHFTWNP